MTQRRRSLTLFLYLIGIVQMCVLLTPALLLMGPPPGQRHGDATEAAVAELLRVSGDQVDVARAALQRLHASHNVQVSVYAPSGELLLTNVQPALPRRGDHGIHDLRARERDGAGQPPREAHPRTPCEWRGQACELSVRTPHARPTGVGPPEMNFLSGFVVIAFGAFITARWILRPLQQLSSAARALGAGDLAARADATRNDELGAVAETFNEMADRVQGLLLAEKELLANVSHELRTPLARIRVALHMATEGDTEASRASLADIAFDLEELEGMIDDIFVAARVAMLGGKINEAGGFAMHVQEIDPAAVAERAAKRLGTRHPSRSLSLSIPAELPLIVADAVLLRRALDNLLENAHKYSPDEAATIALDVSCNGDELTFTVRDRGQGISEADLPRIFEPFYRSDTARRASGIGLGLTLVKRISEAHHGRVVVDSVLGQGTTVKLTIPQRAPSDSQRPETSSALASHSSRH